MIKVSANERHNLDTTPSGLIIDPEIIASKARKLGIPIDQTSGSPRNKGEICAFTRGSLYILARPSQAGIDRSEPLLNIEEVEDGLCLGDTNISINRLWSSEFAHCTDLFHPAVVLLGKIANQDDIEQIDSFRIYEPITRQMKLYGGDESVLNNKIRNSQGRPTVEISFRLKGKKVIKIVGFQKGDEMPMGFQENEVLDELTREFEYDRHEIEGGFQYGVCQPDTEELDLSMSLADRLATGIDMVIRARRHANLLLREGLPVRKNGMRMVAGVDHFIFPRGDELLNWGRLRIFKPMPEQVKITRNQAAIVPYRFSLISPQGKEVMSGQLNSALSADI